MAAELDFEKPGTRRERLRESWKNYREDYIMGLVLGFVVVVALVFAVWVAVEDKNREEEFQTAAAQVAPGFVAHEYEMYRSQICFGYADRVGWSGHVVLDEGLRADLDPTGLRDLIREQDFCDF